jgi:hypothetical protein
MPRNSSGVYSLPAGNPVVTATIIASSWANNTMSDLATAMTDSLSRSGDGGMTAPLELADGAIGAPGLSWGNETNSGLYRAGAGDFRYSIGAADVLGLTANGVRVANGAVGTPAFSFLSDTDTGMYRSGANAISFATNGVQQLIINTSNIILGLAAINIDGTVGAPAYSFAADTDTGIYRVGADHMRLVAGGVGALAIFSTIVAPLLPVLGVDGSAGAPSYSFLNEADCGMYLSTTNEISFAAGGNQRLAIGAGGVFVVGVPAFVDNGTAGAPTYSFSNDTNIGMYRDAADQLGFTTGGTRRLAIFNGGMQLDGVMTSNDGTVGAPAYSFTADSNTGMFRSSADVLDLACGGVSIISLGVSGGSGAMTGNFANGLAISIPTSTTASAGARTLPANPVDFIVVSINGTSRKIPFYAT